MEYYNKTLSQSNYNTLSTDYRVEVVATNILKYQHNHPEIFIKRIGINDRPFLKDVKHIYTSYYGLDEETVIIETFRESIYDYLPEGMFHPPSLGNYNKNVDNIINEIKKQKEIEDNARKFFQPFELEIFYTEIAAMLKEKELDIADDSNAVLKVFSTLWPLLSQVEEQQGKILLHILPFLHEVRGNKAWIEQFLTSLLKVDTQINFVHNVVDAQEDEAGVTRLGNAQLGITLIPNRSHKDGERNWQVNIGPIPYDEIYKYVDGHPFRALLQNVYDYLMPISVKVYEKFVTNKQEESFRLELEGNSSRLGYATFI